MGISWFGRVSTRLAAVLAAAILVPHGGAKAAAALETAQVLYSFCTNHTSCHDGANPYGNLLRDGVGRLYGTTSLGGTPRSDGTPGFGTVFVLTPNATKTEWTETVLHNFCAAGGTACTDGAKPLAGLIRDSEGRLYGTTSSGGIKNGGTVFVMTPNAARTKWTETVLYRFCKQPGCSDGAAPVASLIMDKSGNLYGTTSAGGAFPGATGKGGGTVFELIPNATRTGWAHKVLYNFCAQTRCADGSAPHAGLVMNKLGHLYGTTSSGGRLNAGTVFELVPNASRTRWTERVLYRFCSLTKCADGEFPEAGLLLRAGRLYGTASAGGAFGGKTFGGTVFLLTPDATATKWTRTLLYTFCSRPRCTDGSLPVVGVIADQDGHLYGTTDDGGTVSNVGVAFELVSNATKTAWAERVLYRFCLQRKCADGDSPRSPFVMDRSGHLYGTTTFGGTAGAGEVYALP